MKEVGAFEAKKTLSALLDLVERAKRSSSLVTARQWRNAARALSVARDRRLTIRYFRNACISKPP
jgi:hypothetical protein